MKLERGCEKDTLIPNAWDINGTRFSRCPLKIATVQSFEYIEAYNDYQSGFLPNAGGSYNQPAKFRDAIKVIKIAASERAKPNGK